ncbi:hypothetical protein SUZIE_208515 [Sciurus carolinensis]|uniref:Uncharacterized protein n=1 Tax=Sciurus carolinensis TaxID=30640 RepID=A0AA41TBN9_SCICA|nr:hypothetical protein [Sciurus carolinensis]
MGRPGALPPLPAALPPAPLQGSPCAAAAATTGGSGACGPATVVAAAGTAGRTGRRWLGPNRCEEGSAALRPAGQETGETRSVFRLQG